MPKQFEDNFRYIFNENEKISDLEKFEQILSYKYSYLEFDKRNLQRDKINIDFIDLIFYKFGKDTYFETNYKNAHFECFLHFQNSDRLIVMLSAARTGTRLPRFQRISYSNISKDNYLFVEDPTYLLNDELRVGWFFGDKNNNFCKYTAALIRKISSNLNIKDENVIFLGSSCAGTAAIAISHAFSNSSFAVSINAQINFDYFHKDISDFQRIMNYDYASDSDNRFDICSCFKKVHSQFVRSRILLIENVASRWDCVDHLGYLVKQLNISLSYPLSRHGNLFVWMYYARTNNSHVAHDDKELFPLIFEVINQIFNDKNDISDISKHCQILNYVWKVHYDRKNEYLFYYIDDFNYSNSIAVFKSAELKVDCSQTDNYNHYEICGINNGYYCLDIENIWVNDSNCTEFSIGLFDKHNRTFVFLNNYFVGDSVKVSFFINSDSKRSFFLDIFAGKHGVTKNIELRLLNISLRYINI